MSDETERVQAMIQLTDVESECAHGHLPADRNVVCACWTDDRTDALLGQVPLGWEDYEFDPAGRLRLVVNVPSHRMSTRERDEELAGLYADGLSSAEIAARYGLNPRTVRRALVAQGVKMRGHGRAVA